MPTTKKNNLLEYKGHPLMRKENIIYYGSLSASAERSQRTYERAYRQENREEQHVGSDGHRFHLARPSTSHEVRPLFSPF